MSILLQLLFMIFFGPLAKAETTTIVMGLGQNKVFSAPAGQLVQIQNGKIIKASDQGKSILIQAKKIGQTSLSIGKQEYLIRVLKPEAERSFKKLKNIIKDLKGLTVEIENDLPTLKGRLLRFDDWHLVAHELGQEAIYQFNAELTENLKSVAKQYFQTLQTKEKLSPLSLSLVPAQIFLPDNQKLLIDRYKKIFSPFGFKIEVDKSLLAAEPLVRVQITVAEVRKKSFSRLGMSWPGQYQAQLIPSGKLLVDPKQLSLGINALEESGDGKILASPTLLCLSGKEAEFLAGGELPIRIKQFKTQDIIWKKYGVLLRIKPLADHTGKMSIALETEVSTIDLSQSIDGIPALLTNRIQSHFDLSGSRTIALSGLIKSEQGRQVSGLPGLSQIPILGRLFSSEDYRQDKTELVMFVTPEVVSETEVAHQGLKEEF